MNLNNALQLAAASPNAAGITFVQSNGSEIKLSYKELYHNALHLLGALQQKGLHQGVEVVIQVEDNQQFLCIFWACLLGNMIPVPLSIGVQEEQKHKIFQVWQRLSDPYLICDEQQRQRLYKNNATDGFVNNLENRIIHCRDVMYNATPGVAINCMADELAYIQFSSGSTGEPKGVCLTHDNLLCNIADILQSLAITKQDVLLNWMPLTHDMGLIGFHLTGIVQNVDTVIIPTAVFIRRPALWMDKVSEHRASVLYCPNFGFQYFLAGIEKTTAPGWDLSCVRTIVNGAEQISLNLCTRFADEMKKYGMRKNCIMAAYGLAEAAVEVAVTPPGSELQGCCVNRKHLAIGDKIIPAEPEHADSIVLADVGFTVDSCNLRICNSEDEELEEGHVGHIQIKGRNVTRGYYNDPMATNGLFTTDGWLRTGDVGFMLNKRLIVSGRWKNMVVLNGQNYYPHDFEQVVTATGLADAGKIVACGYWDAVRQSEDVILFLLFRGARPAFAKLAEDIRRTIFLRMGVCVNRIVPVKQIPKTTSGKTRHYLLVEKYIKGDYGEADEFLSVLNFKNPGAEFDLSLAGISSLAVMQLAGRIRNLTGADVPAAAIFRCRSLSELYVLMTAGNRQTTLPVLAPSKNGFSAALSPAQKRIYTEYLLNKQASAYNIPLVYTVEGAPDIQLLETAVRKLIEKYEILRVSFELAGDCPVQRLHNYSDALFCAGYSDVSSFPNVQEQLTAIKEQLIQTPFDLSEPTQLRLEMIRYSERSYLLIFVAHHIITDGWSLNMLFRELNEWYRKPHAARTSIQPAAFQFSDYLEWQSIMESSAIFQQQKKYWENELQGAPEAVGLSVKPAVKDQHIHASINNYTYRFSGDTFSKLKLLATQLDATPFTIVLSLVNVLVYRYTNNRDLLTGFDVTGRVSPELEQVAGYMLNTLCLRVPIDPLLRFQDVVATVKNKLYNALDNQLYPFEYLPYNGHPLFRMLVIYQNFADWQPDFPNCSFNKEETGVNDGFTELLLEFIEENDTLKLVARFDTATYQVNELVAFATHFENLLTCVGDPNQDVIGRLNFLAASEQQIVLPERRIFNIKRLQLPLHRLFELQAADTPDAIAVQSGLTTLTYRELNEQSNILANRLRSRHMIQPNELTGIMVSPGVNIIIAMLGVMKSGGAFVGIPSDMPLRRAANIVEDCCMKCLIVDNKTATNAHDLTTITTLMNLQEAGNGDIANPAFAGNITSLVYAIYTSGTSGKPKGVLIEHQSIADYVHHFIHYFGITGADIFLQQFSPGFDAILEEIFPPLCTGGRIVVAENGGRDIEELASLITAASVTVVSVTPPVLHELNKRSREELRSLRLAISGGDVLHTADLDQLIEYVQVYNTYGPSEATVCATYKKVERPADARSIGRPIAGRNIYILDENRQALPVGKPGQIYIAGGLARGYNNLPVLTREKFVENPFEPQERMYASGDRGYRTAEGEIIFCGRTDLQVKINGYRVEPEDIEDILTQQQQVDNAAVVVDPVKNTLIAFITVKETYSEQLLREGLSQSLPFYMIPHTILPVEEIPVTASGKIDRKVLLSLFPPLKNDEADLLLPRNKTDEKLLALITELLKIKEARITDNLFESGCNSITITRLAGLIYKAFGCQLEIRDFFNNPVIAQLSDRISFLAGTLKYAGLQPAKEAPSYPLSPAQQQMWLLYCLNKRDFAYNELQVYEVEGMIDVEIVRESLIVLEDRFEILRTTFFQNDEEPRQVIASAGRASSLYYFDLSAEASEEDRIEAIIHAHFILPFNLEEGPLYRVLAIHIEPCKAVLAVIMHHIITDDKTALIFMREFLSVYGSLAAGNRELQPRPSLHYKDYAVWVHHQQHERFNTHRQYWKKALNNVAAAQLLPYNMYSRENRPAQGMVIYSHIGLALCGQLDQLVKENNISRFVLLMAGVSALLSAYSGQNDLVIGVPVSIRQHPDLENIPGFFINTLPIRVQLEDDESFNGLIEKMKRLITEALEHTNYPFNNIIDDIQEAGNKTGAPLFDVLVNYSQGAPLSELPMPEGFTLHKKKMGFSGNKFDLSVFFEEHAEGMSVAWEFDAGVLLPETMRQMTIHLENILRLFIQYPHKSLNQYDYLSPEEKQHLLYGVNNNFIDFGNRHVLHIFSGQVKDDPEAVAITCNGRSLSYGEIDQLSDNLAGYFVARIAAAENKTICLLLERNENIIISILAIWKAGATYVPMGHDWPDERIGFILEQTNAQLLVSDELHYQKCVRIAGPSGIDCCCLNSELINVPAGGGLTGTTGEMAYILYTSGSSGEPKGVMVNHHSLANILCSLQLSPGINRNDKFLSVSSYTFDISLVEFFLPLTCGAQVILALTAEIQDTKRLSALIGFHAPTIMQATPGLWHTLIETGGWKGTANMKAITCGEPLTRLLARKLLELTGELWNFYGPTETTIFSTGGQIVDLEGPPGIGLPVANTEVYVLDKWNRLVPAGVWGELHIGGKGLAMGYLKDKTRTRQKFRSNPYRDQHIVYATGDIVRWMANGTLEFKGRSDEQIKVRGYRIEPGEIEHYISRFPGISSVTVTGIPDETGNKYLVAYIISAEEPDTAALQHYLKQYLPLYMIPAHYIRLQSLPLTGSGKIDRKRLMDIKNTAIITGNRQQIVPQNSREQIVLELWENILNRKGISTTDNFFDIGGHSLKANQLVNKILLNTGISISLADIFLHTTIQKQAALIDATEKQTYQHIEIL